MKIAIKTSTGLEAQVHVYLGNNPMEAHPATLVVGGEETQDFAFISNNAMELVEHFLNSEDTDFAVGVTGAKSITTSPVAEANNHGHSLMSVRFKATNNLMPLGELSPNFVPEISTILMASFQPEDQKQTRGPVTTITDFELLGRVVEIKEIEE